MAVLANVNYKPFLAENFPEGKAYFLSKGENPPNGGWMLWVTPVDENRRALLRQWQKASLSLQPFIDKYLSYAGGSPYGPVLESLFLIYGNFQGDRLMESFYWEKIADSCLKMGAAYRPQAIKALRIAETRGYPAAHLFRLEGVLWLMDQNPTEAKKAFERAGKAPLNLTDSDRYLQWLPNGK
jgi:hypothetical protein